MHTQRHTEKHTYTQRERHTETYRHIHSNIHTYTEKHTDTYTDTHRETYRDTYRDIYRETYKQIHTDTNTQKHTYRHIHTDIHTHSNKHIHVLCLVSQWCPTLCDPMTVAHQAPLSMGSSRQEYWSGLPCPPPGDLPDPGIRPGSPALQVDSLLSEPPGKPKKIGVGSLSLLQRIFLIQESNQDLLHCPWTLY